MIAPHEANIRTIEIGPALVHVRGSFAGLIEVPILAGEGQKLESGLDEMHLCVPGEEHSLRPMGRAYFPGGLHLAFFSNQVREARELPQSLQLHWGEAPPEEPGGMDLAMREARETKTTSGTLGGT